MKELRIHPKYVITHSGLLYVRVEAGDFTDYICPETNMVKSYSELSEHIKFETEDPIDLVNPYSHFSTQEE